MLDHHDPNPSPTLDRPPALRGVTAAAITASGLLGAMAGLQVALAAGAPLGQHVWGGRSDTAVLSPTLRASSAFAAAVLVWMIGIILARADLTRANPIPHRWLAPATWLIAAYMVLNTAGNLASTSDVERFIFGTGTAVVALLAAIVAHRGRRS